MSDFFTDLLILSFFYAYGTDLRLAVVWHF